jgi:phosphoribosylformylglycinamidine synthase
MAKEIYRRLHEEILKGNISSCHDCSDGGLGVALAESAFAGDLGMDIDLRKVPFKGSPRDDFILFSESQSRFVITINPERKAPFEEAFKGLPFGLIGIVKEERRMRARGLNGDNVIDIDIIELKRAWKSPLEWIR